MKLALTLFAAAVLSACSDSAPTPDKQSDFKEAAGNINPGTKLYLKSDKAPIGRVITIDSDHVFPNGLKDDGVLVEFERDGSRMWLPREAVKSGYMTKSKAE